MAWTERYASVSGAGAHDGTSAANAWTLAEAIANATSGHRVNLLNGTYSVGTFTWSLSGIWLRGYNTTIGDCDTDPSLTRPLITMSGDDYFTTNGPGVMSSVRVTGARRFNGTIYVNGGRLWLYRCFIENTSTTFGGGYAIEGNDLDGGVIQSCEIVQGGTTSPAILTRHNVTIRDCKITGGLNGLKSDSAGGVYTVAVHGCTFSNAASDAVSFNVNGAAGLTIDRCSFYNAGRDAIRVNNLPLGGSITNSVFSNSAGYNINNQSGSASSQKLLRSNNLSYAATSGHESGFGDDPDFASATDSSSPFTNAGGGDFSLVTGSNGKATGSPYTGSSNLFPGGSFSSYLDRGAAQRQESGGGTSGPSARTILIGGGASVA